jgi:hypothetical protein
MEQKIGGSSRVVNTKSQDAKNSANTESRVAENSTNMKDWATENLVNTEIQVMEDSVNMENWVMQDSGGGARNRKKENALLQAKGQLHGGAQGVLPRHKNADCKRCVKESWPRKMKRKSAIIGLTVYDP